jgi:hypothetical protein
MIEKLEPKFITVDDYNNYWGENLRDMLRAYGANDSYEAERFLARVEIKLINWINNRTFRRIRYCDLNQRQLHLFQLALIEQAKYMFKNGDIGLDSGYNPETLQIADSQTLETLRVSNTTVELLSNAGLFNLTVKDLPRYPHGGGPGDFTNIF